MLVAYIDRAINDPELAIPWATFSQWPCYDTTTTRMKCMMCMVGLFCVLYFLFAASSIASTRTPRLQPNSNTWVILIARLFSPGS